MTVHEPPRADLTRLRASRRVKLQGAEGAAIELRASPRCVGLWATLAARMLALGTPSRHILQ
eukprot:14195119-Alexandrium_andersonii.AAC.1